MFAPLWRKACVVRAKRMTRLVSRAVAKCLHLATIQSRVGGLGQVAFESPNPLFSKSTMARTYKNLWPQLVAYHNFQLAYIKCRRRKRYKKVACEFHFRWEANLQELHAEVAQHNWIPGPYHNFQIKDPKPRLISAAPFRDRVVHHAIVNVLEPLFERRFIFDSYACRRGKGTHRAITRAQYYLRRHRFYLKTDIVKFFPNIDHKTLLEQLSRVVADRQVIELIEGVLKSGLSIPTEQQPTHYFMGDDLFSPMEPKGLPIGNLTSQFFANVLLDPIDHLIKESLRVPGYVRYADDLLLFGNSKQELWKSYEQVVLALAGLRLRLHPNKTHIGASSAGVSFLGCRVFPNQRRLSQASLTRMRRKIRRWMWEAQKGELDLSAVQSSLNAWIAHSRHCNASQIRAGILGSLRLTRRK